MRNAWLVPHTLLLALLLSSLLQRDAGAVIVGAGRLRGLPERASAVVKGRVVAVHEGEFEHLSFTIERLAVLKGEERELPQRLLLQAASPIWPKSLGLPYEENTVALFFLEQRDGAYSLLNNFHAILPATATSVPARSGQKVTARIFTELLAGLPAAKSNSAKAELLVLLGEVATRSDETHFLPYLRHADEWVRRGALAALLRVNPTPERVAKAATEFKTRRATLKGEEGHRFWSLYSVVDEPVAAFLPIYRAIADAPSRGAFDDAAVRGLKSGGKREDAARLYRYAKHTSAYIRHEALDALCRMLGIPLQRPEVAGYGGSLPPEVVAQEKRMQEAVRMALKREGIVTE
ncbi:MAG TPA: hypothetical protein VK689_01175 [Armatimonadota bacterium]|nr:hypothetical protein [Armatimonadota bacterium]